MVGMNNWLLQTAAPGIAEMNTLAEELRAGGEKLINLGQAVPFFSPPKAALNRMMEMVDETEFHRYSPDPGLITLRRKVAEIWLRKFQLKVSPDKEMLITAGANSAYLMTVMTLFNPGDRMGLVTPFYFNHAMAVSMTGGTIVEIPLSAKTGFQLDPEQVIAVALREKLKAVTIVTPGNPTGVTFSPASLRRLAEGLRPHGIFLIVDETYAFFPATPEGHFSPGSLEECPELVVTIGSFSKTFAMTGWRVGYVFAAGAMIREMLKVQDTMSICAPRPGQILAYVCLEQEPWTWLDEQNAALASRQQAVAGLTFGPWNIRAMGRFFAFFEGPGNAREMALALLRQEKVVVIPGDIFGAGLSGTFRLSLGSPPEAEFRDGIQRVSAFLKKHTAAGAV